MAWSKSAGACTTTSSTWAQDFRVAGVDIPLFVGGAALTRKFTATRIAPEHAGLTVYAKDAMDGLDLANRFFTATTRESLIERVRAEQAALAAAPSSPVQEAPADARPPARVSLPRVEPPTPPDLEPHVLRDVALPHIYPFLNLQMLYGKHLGLRGLVSRLLEYGDPKARDLPDTVETLEQQAVERRMTA